MEDMRNSAVNLTIDETSTNFTTFVFNETDILELFFLGLSFLFGLLANTYVIWLIITGAGNGAASEFFVLNLSVCGLLLSLYCLLDFFLFFFVSPSLISLVNFLLGVVITGLPLFQCLICVERYLAVVHPVIFLKYKPLRYRVMCCTVVWIITLGSCLICMHSFLTFTEYSVYMWFLLVQFLLFLSIQLFCCLAVLRALKQPGPGERGRERTEENSIKRKAFYLILMTTVNTVITYAPLPITALIVIVTHYLPLVLGSVSCFCFMLAGFLPPVLYLHSTGKLMPRACHV